MSEPKPTKRACIDIGHKCNINCRMCYHANEGNLMDAKFRSPAEIYAEIKSAVMRGNEWMDFTGGEPTICPEIFDYIAACRKAGLKVCIITNSLGGPETVRKLKAAGVSELLLSIHGTAETHNYITRLPDARKRQINFLTAVLDYGIPFRFNFVISAYNQRDILDTTKFMATYKPRIINFINFNPHHGWSTSPEKAAEVMADFDVVEPALNSAIRYAETMGIGVNLRYYPMCRIDEALRRCVCNNLHVTFDPYEWDYGIVPKLVDAHLRWGMAGSKGAEYKGWPCTTCDIASICGGANKKVVEFIGEKFMKPVRESDIPVDERANVYYYRQHNVRTIVVDGSL